MDINLINVPLKYGSGKDGVDLAFEKMYQSGLLDLINNDKHQLANLIKIDVKNVLKQDKYKDSVNLNYLNIVSDVNEKLAKTVYQSLKDHKFPFVIGGDHSVAIGSIAGASHYYKKLAVIYIDAHGDFNTTKTSPSHNIHGMPLAASMGLKDAPLTNVLYKGQKLNPKNLYHIGGRDFDEGEIDIIKKLNLDMYTMDKIEDSGLNNILDEVIVKIKSQSYAGVHLSFDIDSLDAGLVPGTGYPVINGFTLEEIKLILSKFLHTGFVTSIDFVEYNPLLDDDSKITLKNSLTIIKYMLDSL